MKEERKKERCLYEVVQESLAHEYDALDVDKKHSSKDILAELEEAIALWTYKKGMKEELDIYIISKDREKILKVVYAESYPAKNSLMFESRATTTKEMFDKAFEYFKIEEQEI
jgi:hypothetical protein